MCGIAGFLTCAPDPDGLSRLMAQLAPLRHRGPDGIGTYVAGPEGVALRREVRGAEGSRLLPSPPMPLMPPPPEVQVGLGVQRLSIVDVSDGQAPAFGQTGAVATVLNGEIYNHRPLREALRADGHRFESLCDTEILAHLYEAHGIEGMLSRIRGQFALALWDGLRGCLYLARDPLGIKPLHYAVQGPPGGERLFFGSEPRAILADPAFERRMDVAALARTLLMEAPPAPRTIFEGMHKLAAGHYLQIQRAPSGALDVRRRIFWRLPHPTADRPADLPRASDTQGWKDLLRATLAEAVKTRIPDEVPVAALLSGGIDSGLVTAALAREMTSPLHAYSVGFTDKDFDQTDLAARAAKHLGLTHTVVTLDVADLEPLLDEIGAHQDEPLGDHSLVPTWAVSRAVRQGGYPVAISGDGGDELFAGYPTYLARRLDPLLDALPPQVARLGLRALGRLPAPGGNFSWDVKARLLLEGALEDAHPHRQLRWMGAMGADAMGALLDDEATERLRASDGADPFSEVDAWAYVNRARSPLGQAQAHDVRFYLQDVVLVKVDRASMAHSVESRVPLLDLRLAELAVAMPEGLKLRGLTPKWILRELMKEALPRDIADAPKRGFGMPTARWLRALGRGKLLSWLSPPAGGPALVRPEVVTRLVDEHLSGRRDHRRPLWTLIALRRWQASPWGAGY